MKHLLGAGSAAVALLLAGCGGVDQALSSASSAAAVVTTSAEPTEPANNGQQEYEAVSDVVIDLDAAGLTCTGLRLADAPRFAVEQGSCFIGNDEIVIALHSTVAERDAQATNITELTRRLPGTYRVIVGGNWMVNVSDSTIWTVVRNALGGGRVFATR